MTSRFTVYTDGSGLTGGPAGIAFVAVRAGAVPLEWSLPLPNATNHQAEMLAATHALTELPPRSVIELQSDSEYVVKNWNERLPNWRKHNPWRTSKRRPPDNQKYWEGLIEAVALHGRCVHMASRTRRARVQRACPPTRACGASTRREPVWGRG